MYGITRAFYDPALESKRRRKKIRKLFRQRNKQTFHLRGRRGRRKR